MPHLSGCPLLADAVGNADLGRIEWIDAFTIKFVVLTHMIADDVPRPVVLA